MTITNQNTRMILKTTNNTMTNDIITALLDTRGVEYTVGQQGEITTELGLEMYPETDGSGWSWRLRSGDDEESGAIDCDEDVLYLVGGDR